MYIYIVFLGLFINSVIASGSCRIADPRECDGIHPDVLKTKKSMSPSLLRTITKKEDCVKKIRASTPKDESKEKNPYNPTQFSTQQGDHLVEMGAEKKERGLILDSSNQDSDSLKGQLYEFSTIYLNRETGAIDSSDSKRDESVYQ